MSFDIQGKLVVVEFSILDSNKKAAKAQQIGGSWICNAGAAFNCEAVSNEPNEAMSDAASRLAASGSDIHPDWQAAFEGALVSELVSRGTVNWLFGIAVFELILHCKSGVVNSTRPRRFLVIQRGSANVIFVSDTVIKAFAIADKLAESQINDIDSSLGHMVPLPQGLEGRFRLK